MLTNTHHIFQNSLTIETGFSDFQKMTVDVLKIYFKKQDPKCINYQDYKNLSPGNYFWWIPKYTETPCIMVFSQLFTVVYIYPAGNYMFKFNIGKLEQGVKYAQS